jgi:hypothetical protein
MPKQRSVKPSALYNHNARKVVTRQLNISHNASGRSSYSYASSQVQLEPPPLPPPVRVDTAEQELDVAEVSMDINADYMFDVNGDTDQPAIPTITRPEEPYYENSVSAS